MGKYIFKEFFRLNYTDGYPFLPFEGETIRLNTNFFAVISTASVSCLYNNFFIKIWICLNENINVNTDSYKHAIN